MGAGPLALAVAAVMFAAITAYALFAGADFGGGIWDLLAGGTRRGHRPREQIDQSVTPVWEANHVWLILMLVLLWTAFPPTFAAIMTTLFVPLNLSLLGIFFRGIGFAFRPTARRTRTRQIYGFLFAASSLMTPFFLGTVAGAIATGAVRPGQRGNHVGAWTSTTALLTGALAVAACAYISAVYLVRDTHYRNVPDLTRYFSIRAAAAGTASGALAIATLAAMHSQAPYVFHGLLHRALPLLIASVAAGAVALVLVAVGAIRLLRPVAALAVAAAVWGWAVAQYPWMLPTTLSIRDAAAPRGTMVTELVVTAMVVLFVLPGFVLLFRLQQRGALEETSSSAELRMASGEQIRPEPVPEADRPSEPRGTRLVISALVLAAIVNILRSPRRKRAAPNRGEYVRRSGRSG